MAGYSFFTSRDEADL